MPARQNLVVTQKRSVVKLNWSAEAAGITLGVTGSLFDALAGMTNNTYPNGVPASLTDPFVAGVTNNTAAISRVLWTSNSASATPVGYNLIWAGSVGATAIVLYGNDGEHNFEKYTLKNNATGPTGILTITPTASITGTLILEIVQSSGSVGNSQ
jgi:hypothetical protein